MLFRAHSHKVGRDVHELFANSDVSLSDENSGMVHRVSELSLGNESLKSSFHHLVSGQTQDVIEFSLGFLQESNSYHSSDKSITYYNYNSIY